MEAGTRHCPSSNGLTSTRQSVEELAAGDAMEMDEGQANKEDAMDTGFLGSLEPAGLIRSELPTRTPSMLQACRVRDVFPPAGHSGGAENEAQACASWLRSRPNCR